MTVWRGGRGVKAPYQSTHVRVPEPIKEQVEELIKSYKDGRMNEIAHPIPMDEAIKVSRDILKQKKSARMSLERLLTSIYGRDICL